MLGLIGQNDRMLQCRYHWGCLLPVPTRYLTLPTLVSAFSVLFVWYPFEFSGSMHWLLRVLPKCKLFHSSIRAMSGFLSTSARATNSAESKKEAKRLNPSILPRQSLLASQFFAWRSRTGAVLKERRSPHKSPSFKVKLKICLWTYGGRTLNNGARLYFVHGTVRLRRGKTLRCARKSSATKTITACTRSHGGALSFIAELIGNSHGRQQWICVLFG